MSLWVSSEATRLTNLRASIGRGMGTPGPEGSVAKLAFAELNQHIYELCMDLMGAEGMLYGSDYPKIRPEFIALGTPDLHKAFLRARANSLEGGTSEVMRNILGERVLGLPGDPERTRTWPGGTCPGADRGRSASTHRRRAVLDQWLSVLRRRASRSQETGQNLIDGVGTEPRLTVGLVGASKEEGDLVDGGQDDVREDINQLCVQITLFGDGAEGGLDQSEGVPLFERPPAFPTEYRRRTSTRRTRCTTGSPASCTQARAPNRRAAFGSVVVSAASITRSPTSFSMASSTASNKASLFLKWW